MERYNHIAVYFIYSFLISELLMGGCKFSKRYIILRMLSILFMMQLVLDWYLHFFPLFFVVNKLTYKALLYYSKFIAPVCLKFTTLGMKQSS